MKKIIAALIAVMLAAMPLTALAHSDNNSLGAIPKTAVSPVADGVKDDIYNQGLHIPVRNPHNATPDGGLGGGADSWMLWDDNYLYVFMAIDLVSFYTPDDYADLQVEQPWMLTTVEVIMDLSNQSDDPEQVCQVRANDSGFPNITFGRSNPHLNGDECKPYMETGFAKGAKSYTIEFKINMAEFKKGAEAKLLSQC